MELIEGAPLYEHFKSLKEKREYLSEDRIWNIFIQITMALRYLHKEKGIVHRDLTPNNIMLGENDKVTISKFHIGISYYVILYYKLNILKYTSPNSMNCMILISELFLSADFGLAKQKQQDTSKMNSVVGTILYSCPEVVQSQPYGEKADVWAIGCILYQMCTLNPPFYGNNMLSLVTKVI